MMNQPSWFVKTAGPKGNDMTVTQLDNLQHIARRLNAARLAVRALGTDADHQAVEELILDVVRVPRRPRPRAGAVRARLFALLAAWARPARVHDSFVGGRVYWRPRATR
jgi:hypothetical protein